MDKEYIMQTMQTKGWEIIQRMFLEELDKAFRGYETDGKTSEQIATDIKAITKEAKTIKTVLARLNRILKEPEEKPKENYI